ncbi:MAG: hypothetical protein AAFY78_04325 [Cyanobacteria bacterium J06648_16]
MAALARPSVSPKPRPSAPRRRRPRKFSWFERGMALIATVNLALVAFNLSYIPFRDTYLRFLPGLTKWYGETFKGIEPERFTVAYLELVDDLQDQVAATGLNSRQAEALLSQVRASSIEMVDTNPFEVAGKSGTLEQIKDKFRDRLDEDSSKVALNEFWDADHLSRAGWQQESNFFEAEIRPLIETNYWRSIDFNGLPTDRFFLIDIWFVALFGAEFLARTYTLSRRHENTTWFDAMLWRLYDIPLFLPFWRWLRVIPVVIRLNQSCLVNLEPIRGRLNRVLISQFAVELTEVVFLRIIDQTQNLVKAGQISRWLLEATSQSRYIDLNGVDEIQAIAQRLSQLVVYQVLPQIKPELDTLLAHSVDGALTQAPAYQGLKFLPGFTDLSHQLTQQISAEVSKNLYGVIRAALSDEQGGELTSELISSFGTHFRDELLKDNTLPELQGLISALLEEVKINYVERIADEDVERLQADSYRLYSATQTKR